MNSDDDKIHETSLTAIMPAALYDQIEALDNEIFEHTGHAATYKRHAIQIGDDETLNVIFIPSEKSPTRTFYLGHGFGGSSLMYFPSFAHLLTKGNVLLWEIRGMGFGPKKNRYQVREDEINQFYVEGLASIIQYFHHQQIVFVCHSLSAYILMRYLLEKPPIKQIQKIILLSPVGFTPKDKDRNNSIKSCSDIGNTLLAKLGWKFNLTYKSPMRTICSCCKRNLFQNGFRDFPLAQAERQIMINLFLGMVSLPDGSENVFFRYFLPRVLPRPNQSLVELFSSCKNDFKYQVSIYFGGAEDWVDKTGASLLADKLPGWKVSMIKQCSHMVLMNFPKLKQIIDEEIAE